jgi:hypothetical protein
MDNRETRSPWPSEVIGTTCYRRIRRLSEDKSPPDQSYALERKRHQFRREIASAVSRRDLTISYLHLTHVWYSFDVQYLVLEDFHYASPDQVPQLPFNHCQKVTLICNPKLSYTTTSSYRFRNFDQLPECDYPTSLELQIGWRGPRKLSHRVMHRERSPLATDTVPDLVASLCQSSAPFGSITISPYLDKTGQCHQWCFGKDVPQEIVAPPGYPTLRFATTCHCGNGEETGCKAITGTTTQLC